jgi:hypothetical protein
MTDIVERLLSFKTDLDKEQAAAEILRLRAALAAAPDLAEALERKPDISVLNAFMHSDVANKLTEQFPEVGAFLGAYSMWSLQSDAALAKAKGE